MCTIILCLSALPSKAIPEMAYCFGPDVKPYPLTYLLYTVNRC